MAKTEFDVVVVGAGAAGLAAGRALLGCRASPASSSRRASAPAVAPGPRRSPMASASTSAAAGFIRRKRTRSSRSLRRKAAASTNRRRRGRGRARRSARWPSAWTGFSAAIGGFRDRVEARPSDAPDVACDALLDARRPVQPADRRRQHLVQRRGTGESVRRRSRRLRGFRRQLARARRAGIGRRRPRRGPRATLQLPRPDHRPQRRAAGRAHGGGDAQRPRRRRHAADRRSGRDAGAVPPRAAGKDASRARPAARARRQALYGADRSRTTCPRTPAPWARSRARPAPITSGRLAVRWSRLSSAASWPRRWSAAARARRSAFASDELAGLFGADFRGRIRPLHFHGWRTDVYARGGYSYAKPGAVAQRDALAAPIDERIFFAGEACSRQSFSTAHGAYETGVRAAEAVARALRR